MDRRKTYYMIIDTETTKYGQEVFDIGWLICDKQGNVYLSREFIVQENFAKTFYYEAKRPMYYDRVMGLSIDILSATKIKDIMENDLMEWNAKPFAYNAPFDARVLSNLWQCDVEITDIMPYAFNIASQKTYLRRGYRTAKGNMSMNAENVYRYISGIEDFTEEHTALADCYIEMAILLKALRQHKKIHYEINCSNAWMILNELAENL